MFSMLKAHFPRIPSKNHILFQARLAALKKCPLKRGCPYLGQSLVWGSTVCVHVHRSFFGYGRPSRLEDNVRCDGTESELSDCFYQDQYLYGCGYENAAGISCTGKLLQMSKTITWPTGWSCMYIHVYSSWKSLFLQQRTWHKIIILSKLYSLADAAI